MGFLVLLTLALADLSAAVRPDLGSSFQRDYLPGLMNTQYWAIAQEPSGVMLFGGGDGVAAYDGARWTIHRTANRTAVRSLAVDPRGRIFVGARADFGYLETDENHVRRFVSLAATLSEEDRGFTDVWKTHFTEDGVFFQSNEALFRWSEEGLETWRPAVAYHFSFLVRGELWILERGVGLLRLIGDDLQLVSGGEAFAGDSVYLILPDGEDEVLVATRARGLFRLGPRGASRFETEIDAHLEASPVYHGVALDSGEIALATSSGVLILDRQGRRIQSFDLDNERASYLFVDREGGLWVSLSRGIARIEVASALSWLGEESGLRGVVLDVVDHRGVLYLATSGGLFVSTSVEHQLGEEVSFRQVEGMTTPTFALLPTDEGVLVASNRGLYEIVAARPREILSGTFLSLLRSPKFPDVVYAGRVDGLSILRRMDGGWRVLGTLSGVHESVREIVETPEGDLWLGSVADGLLFVDLPGRLPLPMDAPVRRYSNSHGVPEGRGQVFRVGGEIVFATELGLRRYDDEEGTFRPEERFGARFADGTTWVSIVEEDALGRVWMVHGTVHPLLDTEASFDTKLSVLEPPDYSPSLPLGGELRRFDNQRLYTVIPGPRGLVWIGLEDRLVLLDPEARSARAELLPPQLGVVREGRRTGVAVASGLEDVPRFNHDENSVRFDFSLPSFVDENGNEFQSRLVGLDGEWSEWSSQTSRVYTNLRAGSYRFELRARDPYGRLAPAVAYPFEVLAPIYQTPAAQLVYLLAIAALVFGLDRLRVRRVERRERQLTHLVSLRTDELQESEARYRDLVDNASDVIFTADAAGRISTVNRAVEELLGFQQADLVGRRLADLVAPGSKAVVHRLVGGEVEGRTPVEIEIRTGTGEEKVFEISSRPLVEEGVTAGIEGIARDITQRKQLEERLGHSQRLEAVGRLAGGVAHDFNNELTTILGWTQLLRSDEGDFDRDNALGEIERAGEGAQALTSKLLAFGRKQLLAPRVVSLAKICADLEGLAKPILAENVKLEVRAPKDLWPVRVDPRQMQQALLNLVINATDAMAGSGLLEIEMWNLEPEDLPRFEQATLKGRCVALAVRDDGCGMNDETRERVFEPFFTTKGDGGGSGLGLASVYGTIKQSGGHITVDSELGQGAVFTIYLQASVKVPTKPQELAEPRRGVGRGERILLVEDEPSVRRVAAAMLEREGWEVLEASCAEDALRLFDRAPDTIALVLTDVRMSGMGGVELAVRLRESATNLPIVLMSGYTNQPDTEELGLTGLISFLPKPFARGVLIDEVKTMLSLCVPGYSVPDG